MLHRLAVHVIAAFAKFRKACVEVRCGVLQCVAVCCDAALQRAVVHAFAVFASLDRVVLQCDALQCSALQCDAGLTTAFSRAVAGRHFCLEKQVI